LKRVAILPALNEEDGIAHAVASIPPHAVDEIVVVDNGSTDRTAERALAQGARVVAEPRRGYGAACDAGVRAAPDAGVYVFLDADASEITTALADLVRLVASGAADLALGVREGELEPGAMPWQQRWGNRFLTCLLNMLAGSRLRDLPSLKVVNGPMLRSYRLREMTYGWTVELIATSAFRRARILQVPTGLRRRRGKSKVSGSMTRSMRAGIVLTRTILRVWWRERATR
jgi:glycosyltransferase involved in cell wall biosynthesis